MTNYEYRFELKPGKHVYLPTAQTIKFGQAIIKELGAVWTPKPFFFHLGKRGGHLAAMRPHVGMQSKASLDLTGFFLNVTRTKVARSLTKIGCPRKKSFDIAYASCVSDEFGKHLPYGFPQSMMLATLALEKSALGKEIERQIGLGVRITMYVDDIVLSYDDPSMLEAAIQSLTDAAVSSSFLISEEKSSAPSPRVSAFNCDITSQIVINEERFDQFVEQMRGATNHGRAAILRYVGVINRGQYDALEDIFPNK